MIFLDLETTGLLQPEANDLIHQPYITEIYAVKLNWNEDSGGFEYISEFETLVRPPIPISEEITRITGITTEMLYNQPSFAYIYKPLCDFFLGEKTVVAHNCSFDLGVIRCELKRIGKEFAFPWPHDPQCTVELSMPIEHKRQSLAKLHTLFFGEPHQEAHRAKSDVMALVACYQKLIELGYA